MRTKRSREQAFTRFVEETEPRLSYALAAAYEPEVGAEATADALAYAWEHWERIERMGNPAGHLYRVGQSRRDGTDGPKCCSHPFHRPISRWSNPLCRTRSMI